MRGLCDTLSHIVRYITAQLGSCSVLLHDPVGELPTKLEIPLLVEGGPAGSARFMAVTLPYWCQVLLDLRFRCLQISDEL
jgi:hypothetical protein